MRRYDRRIKIGCIRSRPYGNRAGFPKKDGYVLTEKRKTWGFYLILAITAFLSIGVTWLVLFLTRPVLAQTVPQDQYQDKININQATIEELTYAEGIGHSTAQKIFDFLRQNGPVSEISELNAVNGVGEKRIEALEKIFYAG